MTQTGCSKGEIRRIVDEFYLSQWKTCHKSELKRLHH